MSNNDIAKFEQLKIAAEAGDARAMLLLSLAYYKGKGTDVDLKQYFEWEKKSAEAGNAHAMFNLAVTYLNGEIVTQDIQKAANLFYQSAKKGFVMGLEVIVSKTIFKTETPDVYNNALIDYLEFYYPVYAAFTNLTKNENLISLFRNFLATLIDEENTHLYQANDTKQGGALYHYTSQVVLDALLGHRKVSTEKQKLTDTLRLYMASYLNDPTEGRYIFAPEFEFSTDSKLASLRDVKNHFEPFMQDSECLVSETAAQVYSLSFSKTPDNLDMWRAYGKSDDKANGVNIAIPADTLAEFSTSMSKGMSATTIKRDADEAANNSSFLLYEVKYGKKAVTTMWKRLLPPLQALIDEIGKIKRINQATKQKLYEQIYLSFSRISYLYKHDAYARAGSTRITHGKIK